MSDSDRLRGSRTEHAFLDANVLRGQLTTDLLLTLAERRLLEPQWSQPVIDEMRRNRPAGVSEQRIDRRIDAMNEFFPEAMVSGHDHLEPEMPADPKDRHVLAAAIHGRADVLVTDNVKDFHPPSTGPHAMRVESLSRFLNRKLREDPARVVSALQTMVDRNRRDPQTMPALIDKMAGQPELRAFAQQLNEAVPPEQRGSHDVLTANQRAGREPGLEEAASKALDGVAPASGAVAGKPTATPEPRHPGPTTSERDHGAER